MRLQSYGARLADLAVRQPDAVAIHMLSADANQPDRDVTFAELDRAANRAAHLLARHRVGAGSLVVVSLPDVALHAVVTFGAWRLGACVLPVSPRMPERERSRLLSVTGEFGHVLTVGELCSGGVPDLPLDPTSLTDLPEDPLPDVVAEPALAIGSGGTSGSPKITLDGSPGTVSLDEQGDLVLPPLLRAMGARKGQVRLVCTPLYHVNAFGMLSTSVLMGDTAVLVQRFDAGRVLDAVERYRIGFVVVVPAVLQRLALAPGFDAADLSSLEAVGYGGSPCPEWLTRRWIERIGATRVYAGYGATEAVGKTVLRGDEWLAHPGSCGRPFEAEVRILGDDGSELTTGEIGEIYMRPHGATRPLFRYLGAEYRGLTEDGYVSLGDFGRLDADGYLYIADRRSDLIITGGANVYPAEVEAVLTAHPSVADAAVVGLPDDEWGQRVHAIVETSGPVGDDDLDAWCRERLEPYKRPKSVERVEVLPRTEVGKVSRAQLVAERVAGRVVR